MPKILFVSVNKSFDDDTMSVRDLEPWVERAWAVSVAKASEADRVVAVVEDEPIAAWRVRDAFPTDETYRLSNGDTRPRVGLSLGDPLPVISPYREVPALRRGVATKDLDCSPLRPERT